MNLYVKNLAYKVLEEELKQLFEQLGVVKSVRIMRNELTGKSKGYGFVEMVNNDEAINAINKLNQTKFRERLISVNKATVQSNNIREEPY